jgi:hypothetical protein
MVNCAVSTVQRGRGACWLFAYVSLNHRQCDHNTHEAEEGLPAFEIVHVATEYGSCGIQTP